MFFFVFVFEKGGRVEGVWSVICCKDFRIYRYVSPVWQAFLIWSWENLGKSDRFVQHDFPFSAVRDFSFKSSSVAA